MKTLFDKVWDAHVVDTVPNGPQIIYIDKHLIHEVTSPQAFAELESRNLEIFRPKQIVATADHNVPTLQQELPIRDELSRTQVQQLTENCKKNNIELYGLGPFPCTGNPSKYSANQGCFFAQIKAKTSALVEA